MKFVSVTSTAWRGAIYSGALAVAVFLYGMASTKDLAIMLRWLASGFGWVFVPMAVIAFFVVRVGVRDRIPAPATFERKSPSIRDDTLSNRVAQAVALLLSFLVIGQPPELIGSLAGLWGAFSLAYVIQAAGFRSKERTYGETYWTLAGWSEKPGAKSRRRGKQPIYYSNWD